MQVPFKAVWPPILLTALDLLAVLPTWILGWWPLALLLGAGALVLIFDIRGRGLDYRNVHRHLSQGRDPARVAKTYQYSWCGRVACRAAAIEAGRAHGDAVEAYYRENGYRWFHIFPDNTFSLNSPFLTLRFWQITLFGNTRAAEVIARGNAAGPAIVPVEVGTVVEAESIRRAA